MISAASPTLSPPYGPTFESKLSTRLRLILTLSLTVIRKLLSPGFPSVSLPPAKLHVLNRCGAMTLRLASVQARPSFDPSPVKTGLPSESRS